jgi:hypothetical protein
MLRQEIASLEFLFAVHALPNLFKVILPNLLSLTDVYLDFVAKDVHIIWHIRTLKDPLLRSLLN